MSFFYVFIHLYSDKFYSLQKGIAFSVFNAECTHFAKTMQNGAIKLGFLTKIIGEFIISLEVLIYP